MAEKIEKICKRFTAVRNARTRVCRAPSRASAHYKSRYATAAAADNANHRKGLSRAASINHRAPVLIVLSTKEAPAGCGLRVPPLPRLNGAVPRRSSSVSRFLLFFSLPLSVSPPRAPWCHRGALLSVFGVGFAVAIRGRKEEDRRAPRQGVVDTEEIMTAVPRAEVGRRRASRSYVSQTATRRDILAKIRLPGFILSVAVYGPLRRKDECFHLQPSSFYEQAASLMPQNALWRVRNRTLLSQPENALCEFRKFSRQTISRSHAKRFFARQADKARTRVLLSS